MALADDMIQRSLQTFLMLLIPGLLCACAGAPETVARPNIILIMTDDQGYGDLGFTGNPVVRTPNLDAMASRSARMTTFYVSPVCAPTRASLMTGRYNYRTRVVDTFVGRAMMEPDEVTIAEILREAGYRTGIFGKWHLGDAYPLRAVDQGFEEALVHRGGGIGQPSDPPGGESKYTDAILFHNGEPVQTEGYITDVLFDEALGWIEQQSERGESFFAYIATNAPHGPFDDVPDGLLAEYAAMNLENQQFPQDRGWPLPDEANTDRRARIFAMITNIDDNVGRLFERLDALGLTDNTIVVYLHDNGPNGRRYVAGMRGQKSEVYEGGIRSPLFVHWPARLAAGRTSDRVAAHIDVLPTLLDAAGVALPEGSDIDGRSFLPPLTGESTEWPDRNFVIQTHRGDVPVRYHHFMIRNQRWKLVHPSGFGRQSFDGAPVFELYDMQADPLESTDIAKQQPETVQDLLAAYDAWFDDVGNTRADNYLPPRIVVGTPSESPTVLTRQDWRGGTWAPDSNGYWELEVATSGTYDIDLRFPEIGAAGTVTLSVGEATYDAGLEAGSGSHSFESVPLSVGPLRLQITLNLGGVSKGPWQADVSLRPGG